MPQFSEQALLLSIRIFIHLVLALQYDPDLSIIIAALRPNLEITWVISQPPEVELRVKPWALRSTNWVFINTYYLSSIKRLPDLFHVAFA